MSERELKLAIIENADKIAHELSKNKDVEVRVSQNGVKVISVEKKVV